MTCTLRPAAEVDLPSITAIYAHHVRHGLASFEIDPPSEAEMGARFAAIRGAGYPYLVAVDGVELCGYAYASVYRTRPAYRFTVEDSVYVAPDATRRGTGRALLQRLIADCETRGYRQMLAVIGDSANAASIGLHCACGFTQAGVLQAVGFKFDRWVDSVIMQRALGQGDRAPPEAREVP